MSILLVPNGLKWLLSEIETIYSQNLLILVNLHLRRKKRRAKRRYALETDFQL